LCVGADKNQKNVRKQLESGALLKTEPYGVPDWTKR